MSVVVIIRNEVPVLLWLFDLVWGVCRVVSRWEIRTEVVISRRERR